MCTCFKNSHVQHVETPGLDFVQQLWCAWVAQHSGRVIASSIRALQPSGVTLGIRAGGEPYTADTFQHATDVVLLPLGSYAVLTAAMQFAAGQLAREEACAAVLTGQPLFCHDSPTQRILDVVHWHPPLARCAFIAPMPLR